ncbi:unnamed protein product, partial [Prorocentrum cordatum]
MAEVSVEERRPEKEGRPVAGADEAAENRDVNVVLTLRADAKIQLALEEGADEYNEMGKQEREKGDFKGHPWGKRPDAQMKM